MKVCKRCELSKAASEFYSGRAVCKECKRSDSRKYYAEHILDYQAAHADYYSQNSGAVKDRVKIDRALNPDKHRAYARQTMANRVITGQSRAACAKRRTKINSITPSTIEALMIKYKYEEAARLSLETGTTYHVDHIWPVSRGGPHLPWNLQVLTAEENLSKGAKL